MLCAIIPLSSCALFFPEKSAPERSLEEIAGLKGRMKSRAERFREAVSSKCAETGIFIDRQTCKVYSDELDILTARCAMLGITDIYINFTSNRHGRSKDILSYIDFSGTGDEGSFSSADSSELSELISAFHKRKIRVNAVISDPYTYYDEDRASSLVSQVRSYNWWRSKEKRFDGVTGNFQAHMLKPTKRQLPTGILYRWQPGAYGTGRDNDMLMRQVMKAVDEMEEEAEGSGMTVSQALGYFYHEKADEGALSSGLVSDYLKHCDYVIIFAFTSDKLELFEWIRNEVSASKKDDSVLACVRTSPDVYGEQRSESSMSSKGFFTLTKDLEYLVNKTENLKSFRGISFSDYRGLELMWERP